MFLAYDEKYQQHDFIAKNYFDKLAYLNSEGVLQGNVFYPLIGGDLFPAYFADCYGLDMFLKQRNYSFEKFTEDLVSNKYLPEEIKKIKGSFNPISCDFFDYETYAEQLKTLGGINVLFIKGLFYWLATYQLAMSGKQCLFKQDDYDGIKDILISKIEKILISIDQELMSNNSFIVIADSMDMCLDNFITKELAYKIEEKYLIYNNYFGVTQFRHSKEMVGGFSIALKDIPIKVYSKNVV